MVSSVWLCVWNIFSLILLDDEFQSLELSDRRVGILSKATLGFDAAQTLSPGVPLTFNFLTSGYPYAPWQ